MPYYEQLVTRTRRIAALGAVQELEIKFDVIEGGRFRDIVHEFPGEIPAIQITIASYRSGGKICGRWGFDRFD